MNSFLGRCPACEQLVTLPAEARDREVACPACQQRARAVEFGAVEAPPAVLVLPPMQAAEPKRAPRVPERRATARAVAEDEARTHLVLDLPCDEPEAVSDEERQAADAKTLLGPRTPPRSVAPRAQAGAEERTHLLLDAAELLDDHEADAAPHARPRARTDNSRADTGEEPTRLAFGPLSLPAGAGSPVSRMVSGLARILPALLRLSVWLQELVHTREDVVLGVIALSCGLVAPVLDYLSSGSTLAGFTLSCQLSALALLGVLTLNGLRQDEGKWDPTVALGRVRAAAQLSLESLQQWSASPRSLQCHLLSRMLVLAGLAGLGWASLLDALWWLSSLPGGASALPFSNGLLLLGGIVLGRRARQLAPTPRFSLHELGNSVAAAAALPPLLELSDALPAEVAAGRTTLHQSLVALAHWRPREWPTEAAYRRALERHLQRQLRHIAVERERWLGPSRLDGVIDLVVDGTIVIVVQRGGDAAAAERALGQLQRSARAWSGKPMILAIFADQDTAPFDAASAAWVDLRKNCALLAVRMPRY